MANPPLHFIVVGPQRTASSWLHQMLEQHPDLSLPCAVKETFFWDKRFEKGWEWYEKFFSEDRDGPRRRGEVAPTVFASDAARERIRSAVPECRIVIVLRDPVERALSHYKHEMALGLVRGSLREAVQQDPRIFEGSRYSRYLPRWREDFGRDRVYCLRQEEIRKRPEEVLSAVCRFLEIDHGFRFSGVDGEPSQTAGVRFPQVARYLYRTASRLRGAHFHRVVNFAARIGIRRVLQGNKPISVSDEDRRFAEEALVGEREYVEGLIAGRTEDSGEG